MIHAKSAPLELSQQYQAALSRWDNEGGAGPGGPQDCSGPARRAADVTVLTNAELVQLRIRVIALENLLVGLLATASREQIDVVLGTPDLISPRPGSTQHPLTIQAATHMLKLVERAVHLRGRDDSCRAL